MDALIHGLAAGGFDGLQPVIRHATQDLDHLPVAVIAALQLTPDRGHRRGSTQSLNGAPLRSAPGLRARTGT